MRSIAIIAIFSYGFVVWWLESIGSRVVYELNYKKTIMSPYVVLIQSILGKLPLVPVGYSGTLELFRTACATPFRAIPATAGRLQAMVSGYGSSTRGHWDGPVTAWPIINFTGLQRAKSQWERFHVNTTHCHVWAMLPSALAVLWQIYLVLCSASALIQQDKHLAEVSALWRPTCVAVARGRSKTVPFRNIFDDTAVSDVYECIPAVN